ncbi:MAG: 30S ribosomal protein S16 [Candidatus Uhrbacteria bacterium]|nr:30S ribosomal protein S16 [Candidatus Uhrbacteria bacterium]
MLHIRFRRVGKKKQPMYRMIVCEKAKDPWGDYLENLGTFNPRVEADGVQLKEDRIKEWISKGAQCSDTVWNLLVDKGIVKGDKRKTMEISKRRAEKLTKSRADKQAKDEAKQAAAEAKRIADAEAKKAAEQAAKEAEEAEEAAKAEAEAPKAEEVAPEAPAEEAAPEAPAAE